MNHQSGQIIANDCVRAAGLIFGAPKKELNSRNSIRPSGLPIISACQF